MTNSNITAYQKEPSEFKMFYCRCFIRDNYYIASGDETFYKFIGDNICFSIPELLHPEDVEEFLAAVAKLEEEPQHLMIRLKNGEQQYRCLYAVLQLNGKEYNGFLSFNMELCDIMFITDRYVGYCDIVKKYRKFMTLSNGMFFEYDFKTDILQLYEYYNSQSKSLYRQKLEDTFRQVQSAGNLSLEQRAEFQTMYEAIRNGREQFQVEMDAEVFSKELKNVRCRFKCAILYKEDERDKVVGLVSTVGGKQREKSYYLSENAYDPGTGLLNKRAIREYAVARILRQPKSIYLAIMDVDDFKRINDTFGHLYGDEVLSKVSEIVRSVLDDRGVAGRFGGDEFMIVFEEVYTETDLRRILRTISKHIQWVFHDVEGLSVTLSIGVVKYPEDGERYEELFKKADKCLYIAKAKGKNRYIIYDEKKHGKVDVDSEADSVIGIKATVSEETKHNAVSEMVLKLHREGKEALSYVMEQMQRIFDMDGIALFAGEKMQRVDFVGEYTNPITELSWAFEKAYQEYFDEQGIYSESQIICLKNKCPEAYRRYMAQGNGKFVQCLLLKEGAPKAAVAFDFFNRAPKYGITDMGLIKILARMMVDVLAEEKIMN